MCDYVILYTTDTRSGHISVLHDHCVTFNCNFQDSAKWGKTSLIRIDYAYFTSRNVNTDLGQRANNVLLCKFLARSVKNLVSVFQPASLHLCFLYPPLTKLSYPTLNLTHWDSVLIDQNFSCIFLMTFHILVFISVFFDLYFWLAVFPMAFYTMTAYILWPQNYITFNKSKYKPPCHVFCSVASLEKVTWRLYLTKTKRTERGIKQRGHKI